LFLDNKGVMRILMISWEYPPHIEGGLGRHVAELVPALAEQDIALHIVTPVSELSTVPISGGKESAASRTANRLAPTATIDIENGVTVHRVFTPVTDPNADIFGRVSQINQLIKAYVHKVAGQHGPWQLIHNHDWLTGFSSIALKQMLQCPLVTTIHATERGRVRGHLSNPLQWSIDNTERDLIHASDRVIVCSRYMFNELQEFFQVLPGKLDIVPNGVDISSLQTHAHKDLTAFRVKYAQPDEQIIFTISRLVYEKGVHRLIEAMPRILHECPSARLVVAGKGPEADNLQHLANHLGVAHRVALVGFITDDDRNRLFKIANCAMFPSLYEPFGIVVLEAMALGCPVVVSDVGGFSEMVTHKVTGITTYPDDPQSIAWGILRILQHPRWARQHANEALKTVEEKFNWDRIARLTKEVYQRSQIEHQHRPQADST